MTDLEQEFRLKITPDDPDGSKRAERLKYWGALPEADPEYDDIARRAVELTGASHAGVNFVGEGQTQYFAGIAGPGTDGPEPALGREMDGGHGYCLHVVARSKALALNNVMDYARFSTDPVVDLLGVRSYMGAPLVDEDGHTIGTVWVVDSAAHEWKQDDIEIMKGLADEVMASLRRRSGHSA